MTQEWIPTSEASKLSGYHSEYIRELARNGLIRAQKFGYVWQIDKTSLQNYLIKVNKKGQRRGPKPRQNM